MNLKKDLYDFFFEEDDSEADSIQKEKTKSPPNTDQQPPHNSMPIPQTITQKSPDSYYIPPKTEPKKQPESSFPNSTVNSSPPRQTHRSPDPYYIPPVQKKTPSGNSGNPGIKVPNSITLADDEVPLWYGQMSWVSLWPLLLIAMICFISVFLFIVGILFIVLAWLNVATTEYFVSNRRIFVSRGLISRQMNDIKIEWVTNIAAQQSISGRIMNFGTLMISSPGERAGAVFFWGISDPIRIKGIIDNTLVKYKFSKS